MLRLPRRLGALGALAAGVPLPVGFGLHWRHLPSRPSTDANELAAIEMRLEQIDVPNSNGLSQERPVERVTEDKAKEQLLDVFKYAERASEHTCGSCGQLTIVLKNGSRQELFILPGHDPAWYEYRYGPRINRVDRERFLAALRAVGVSSVKLKPP